MRDAAELVKEVEGLGITLKAEGDRIRIKGPKRTLTGDLLSELRKHKKELLELEHWEFRKVEIPCQLRPAWVDVWMVGERRDRFALTFWFVRSEPKEKP
jgi:hypothetical protein